MHFSLQYSAVQCSAVQCSAVLFIAVQYSVEQCSGELRNEVHFSAMQYTDGIMGMLTDSMVITESAPRPILQYLWNVVCMMCVPLFFCFDVFLLLPFTK